MKHCKKRHIRCAQCGNIWANINVPHRCKEQHELHEVLSQQYTTVKCNAYYQPDYVVTVNALSFVNLHTHHIIKEYVIAKLLARDSNTDRKLEAEN